MQPLRLTPEQVREIDRIAIEEYKIPSLELMESAAGKVVECILLEQETSNLNRAAIILCGKGNNAGDGFAIARMLKERQWNVIVVLFESTEYSRDSRANYKRLHADDFMVIMKSTFFTRIALNRSFVIDAIYGTGFRPPSQIDFREINEFSRMHDHHVIAVDVPSGLNALDGSVVDENAIHANQTVTFVCEKTGFGTESSKQWTGEVLVADIGIPEEIVKRVSKGS